MKYYFKLFIAGNSDRSTQAIANLKQLVDEYLSEDSEFEIIDVLEEPFKAVDAEINATPTIVKQLPSPIKKSIADLSNIDEVLFWLGIKV